uniref:Vinculin n=1 Tax=Phlebotomus papatasi TaxID=29031 RepID=A0A1B0DHH8_PHLPP
SRQLDRWLNNPTVDDRGLGKRAIDLIVAEGKQVAEGLPGHQRAEILALCDEVEALSDQFAKLCAAGLGDTPEAQEIARRLNAKLHELKKQIQTAVVGRVVEDFMDVATPLKQFMEAVNVPEGTPGRDQNFAQKAAALQAFSDRAAKTSRMVAAGGSGGNKKLAEILLSSAAQIDSLTPQLISAGRIRMNYPGSKAAEEHLNNLKQQYADTIARMRAHCDQATDPADFIKASEEQMQKHTFLCEEAIRQRQPQKMVDNTTGIARLANRVLAVVNQEADNSEDPEYIGKLNACAAEIQNRVPQMVQDAKAVATNISDPQAAECKRVLDYLAVSEVIDTMEDLVQFLKDLSPCLSKVTREVSAREKELTHQVHSEILVRCMEQVKILAPILICSMKVYIHIVEQDGKGAGEAAENRNYLAARMSDEIQEIIRVLQLTTYDEDQSELDNLTVLKKLSNAIRNKMETAMDWLANPYALKGGVGEKALRQIVENALKIADRCLPQHASAIRKVASDVTSMTNALCELRQDGKGTTPQAENLAREIRGRLTDLNRAVQDAVIGVSRLVILHEEAEDGNAMPDLSRPVQAVSIAVTNLVKVGRETINNSDDDILKQDMPHSLARVEDASQLLEQASAMLRADPYSGPARKKLIEGSRGILQGTSALLLCFDESEVRKIIRSIFRGVFLPIEIIEIPD